MNELSPTLLAREAIAETPRDLILAVATRLFTQYGFAKTTIGDIASECGMSPANLYRYYRNKQSIGCAVAATYMANVDHICAEAAASEAGGAEKKLRAAVIAQVMHTVARLRETPKMVELAEMVVEVEEGRELLDRHIAHRSEFAASLVAQGVASGEFRVTDVERAARGFLTGLKFFFAPFALARHGLDSIEDDLAATLDLLCAGLRAG